MKRPLFSCYKILLSSLNGLAISSFHCLHLASNNDGKVLAQ